MRLRSVEYGQPYRKDIVATTLPVTRFGHSELYRASVTTWGPFRVPTFIIGHIGIRLRTEARKGLYADKGACRSTS